MNLLPLLAAFPTTLVDLRSHTKNELPYHFSTQPQDGRPNGQRHHTYEDQFPMLLFQGSLVRSCARIMLSVVPLTLSNIKPGEQQFRFSEWIKRSVELVNVNRLVPWDRHLQDLVALVPKTGAHNGQEDYEPARIRPMP